MMSALTREQMYEGFKDYISERLLTVHGGAFKEVTRRWRSAWDDPSAMVPELPLLIVWEQNENVTWSNRGIGGVLYLDTMVEIYAKIPDGLTGPPGVPDKSTPGSKTLNPLIDAINDALAPDERDTGFCTLGGLVIDCRIEGNIVKVLGDEDPSGLCGALVPVRFEVLA